VNFIHKAGSSQFSQKQKIAGSILIILMAVQLLDRLITDIFFSFPFSGETNYWRCCCKHYKNYPLTHVISNFFHTT